MNLLRKISEWFTQLKRGSDKYLLLADTDLISWRAFPARLQRLRLSRMASSISYFMVFAIFPFLILLLTLVMSFGDSLLQTVSASIDFDDFFPAPVLDLINGLYQDAIGASSISAISVSIVFLVWAASKGINAIIISMRQIYHRSPTQTFFFISRLFSIVLTILAGFFIVAVMVVLAFSEAVLSRVTEWTGIVIANRTLIRVGSFVTGFTILNLTFWIIYYFSSARQTKVRHALAASSLAALSWVASSALFSIFVSRSSTLTIYGGMTGVVILMLWLYVCAYSLLLGAAFHATLRDRDHAKEREIS